MGKKEEQEMHRDERIEQTGQLTLTDNKEETSIHLLTIIGEIEGHDNLGSSSKTTKLSEKLKDTNVFRQLQKRQNMNIFYRSWRR